jgi:hypothetical protein
VSADAYQYTVQLITVSGWCCWVSWGGRTKHFIENAASATDALEQALNWAESSANGDLK